MATLRNKSPQRKRRRILRPGGFSLIEVLLGATLLVIGMLGALTMFSTGYVDVNNAGSITSSVAIARQMLEDMRLVATGDLTAFNGSYFQGATGRPGTITVASEIAMAQRWQASLGQAGRTAQIAVAMQVNTPLPDTWAITVTILGTAQSANASGRVPNVVLSTIVR